MRKMVGAAIGLIVAIAVFVLFSFGEQSTETTIEITPAPVTFEDSGDTIVYSSEKLGLSFHYKDGLRLVDNDLDKTNTGGHLQIFNYPEDKYMGGEDTETGDFKIEITVLNKEVDMTLRDFVASIVAGGLNNNRNHLIQTEDIGKLTWVTDEIENQDDFKSFYAEINSEQVLAVTVFPFLWNQEELKTILSSMTIE